MAAVKTDSLQLVACPRERPTCLVTSGVLDSIGCTPLMLLKQASEATDCLIYAKAEYINPGSPQPKLSRKTTTMFGLS